MRLLVKEHSLPQLLQIADGLLLTAVLQLEVRSLSDQGQMGSLSRLELMRRGWKKSQEPN